MQQTVGDVTIAESVRVLVHTPEVNDALLLKMEQRHIRTLVHPSDINDALLLPHKQ